MKTLLPSNSRIYFVHPSMKEQDRDTSRHGVNRQHESRIETAETNKTSAFARLARMPIIVPVRLRRLKVARATDAVARQSGAIILDGVTEVLQDFD